MSDVLADQLREWVSQLDRELNAVEQTWLKVRRLRSHRPYASSAEKLEQAADLIREAKTEISLHYYEQIAARKEKEKA